MQDLVVRSGQHIILSHIDLTIYHHEQWAITGPLGSGKTTLAHTLMGRHYYQGGLHMPQGALRISMVEQQHRFRNLSNTTDFYYQQRFNSMDADQTVTVQEYLRQNNYKGPWLDLLHLTPLLHQPIIQLSNGQNKRLQLALALADDPDLLILDSPFTGLDQEGRNTIHHTILKLIEKGVQLLLITPPQDIFSGITHVAELDGGQLSWAGKREDYRRPSAEDKGSPLRQSMLHELEPPAENNFDLAVKMTNTTIRYGEKTVLDNLNWEVKRGERWNVSGPNGAGKSTLLSLITADNPQAYANNIVLFDRRRGSGESIWEIKKKIGFVSPELHLYFDYSATCFEVIASGLFDTIGLFRALDAHQEHQVQWWLRFLQLETVGRERLARLSAGLQRFVLLARALVKNPPLLILDEPCQGLDDGHVSLFKSLVNDICEYFGATLIYVSHYERDIPSCVHKYLRLQNGVAI